jgi:hypothetical protein
VLLLIFAFVGIEVALVPSGEVRDPRRTVPRAIYLALGVTTVVYLAVQAVAQGVLGAEMAQHAEAPLAAAAGRFLGEGGRLLVLAGGAVSMFGYLSGDMLSSPRSLYAFGRDGPAERRSQDHPPFRRTWQSLRLLAAVLAITAASPPRGPRERLGAVLASSAAPPRCLAHRAAGGCANFGARAFVAALASSPGSSLAAAELRCWPRPSPRLGSLQGPPARPGPMLGSCGGERFGE